MVYLGRLLRDVLETKWNSSPSRILAKAFNFSLTTSKDPTQANLFYVYGIIIIDCDFFKKSLSFLIKLNNFDNGWFD